MLVVTHWAGLCAFSLLALITQRDARVGCGRSGQPRPPASWRTEPQLAGYCSDVPGAHARVRGLARILAGEIDGIEVSRPGSLPLVSCVVARGQPHRQRAMGLCGVLDGRSTSVTAIEEDPVGMHERKFLRPLVRVRLGSTA